FSDEMIVTLRVAPRMRIEIVLAAIHLDDEPLLQADKIDDMAVARGLAAKVESVPPPRAQMNPQFHFLPRHAFAKTARGLVRHDPTRPRFNPTRPRFNPTRPRFARRPSPFRGGITERSAHSIP